MGLEIKPGVRVTGIRTETLLALRVIEGAFADAGYPTTTLTSGVEGSHSRGSLHYTGCAVDIRISNVPTEKLPPLRDEIARRLGGPGGDYDVVLEGSHFHIEFQPKKPINEGASV